MEMKAPGERTREPGGRRREPQRDPAMNSRLPHLAALLLPLALAPWGRAADLETALRGLDARVLDAEQTKQAPRMLSANVRARIQAANERDAAAWARVRNRDDWEKFRDARIKAL